MGGDVWHLYWKISFLVRSRETPGSDMEERWELFETGCMISALEDLYSRRYRDRSDVRIMDFGWNDSTPPEKGHYYRVTFVFDSGPGTDVGQVHCYAPTMREVFLRFYDEIDENRPVRILDIGWNDISLGLNLV